MRSGTLALAVLRAEYEAARFPLQLIEDVAMSQLDERAPLRLAYEDVLVTVDRAAAHLLDDGPAALWVTTALRQRRTQQCLAVEGAARM